MLLMKIKWLHPIAKSQVPEELHKIKVSLEQIDEILDGQPSLPAGPESSRWKRLREKIMSLLSWWKSNSKQT